MYNAFISYRKTSSVNADFIRQSIIVSSSYSEDDIFLDKHSIGPELFDSKISTAIAESNCIILLVTKDCFKAKDDGNEDWFLEEIKHAILFGKKIIPVLFDKITSLQEEEILTELNKNFTEQEVDILLKSQCIQYSVDYPNASIEKLVSFIDEANKAKSITPIIIGIIKLLGITIVAFAGFLALFFGLGTLWGYFATSTDDESVLIDNSTIQGDSIVFEYRGWNATYDIGQDTIILHLDEFDNKPKIGNVDLVVSSFTIAGAKVILKRNIAYLKYAKFLRGGSKQAKIAFVCVSAAACVGAFCGFSQGNNFGKSKRQEETALRLYPKLQKQLTWEPVVKQNLVLSIVYYRQQMAKIPFVSVIGTPVDSVCAAYQAGLKSPMILLKYNEWEFGTNTFKELLTRLKEYRDQEKSFVFLNSEDLSISEFYFKETNIVGILFNMDEKDIIETEIILEKLDEWKEKEELL